VLVAARGSVPLFWRTVALRAVFVLFELEEMTMIEIAALLMFSEPSVSPGRERWK